MTKAPIRPPKSARAGFATGLTAPATMNLPAPDNIQDRNYMDLNFKVSPAMHAEFKAMAAMRHKKMKEFLEEIFEFWKEKNAK